MDQQPMSKRSFAPLVSIIIPVYNGSNYMREAIDSALNQTYKNIEIIVVNDGSRDDGATERIAKSYGDRIRYIAKENGGVSTALNVGIRNMHGDYFSWLSHDDVYMPDKVEKSVEALAGMENVISVVYCAYTHIDENSRLLSPVPKTEGKTKTLISWKTMLSDLFCSGSLNGCSFLIKKSVFDEVGLFDEELRFYQDTVMWFKIFMAQNDVLMIPDVCVKGRVHRKQLTQTGQALFRRDCEKISTFMIPRLAKISTPDENILLTYTKYNAKYCNTAVVKNACAEARKARLFRCSDFICVSFLFVFGAVRPLIRQIYYAVFRGVKAF